MMSESDFRLPMLAARKDSQPLMLNNQSHPAYQPVKLSVKTAVDMKSSKIRAPEKPMSPYMRYARKVGESVKLAHPEAKAWEVGKIIANMWRDLNDMERQDYINEYEAAKAEYGEQLKQYHNSPQYQSFLTNNSKKKYPVIGQPGGMAISGGSGGSSNAIEPAEEDGIDDSLSSKHVAASRYLRNHRLLNEIFSEYVVADSRSIITMQRMDQLKKQVHSLEMHHEKLKQELNLIEEKFETKRKRILTDSDSFNNELNKLKEFKVSEEHTTNYYTKHYDQLQKQWKEHCDRFLAANAHKLNENELQHQLRESLENLVNVNKNLISVSNPQSVTVVALQVADHPSTTTSGSSSTAPTSGSSNASSQLTGSTQAPPASSTVPPSSQPVPASYTSHATSAPPASHPSIPASNPAIPNVGTQAHHSTAHHQTAPTPQQPAHHPQATPGQVVGHMPMNAMSTPQQTAIYGQMPMQASGQPQQQPGIHPMQMHGPTPQMMPQQMAPQMMPHPSQHPNMPVGGAQPTPAQQQPQQAVGHPTGQTQPGVVVGQPQVGYMQMPPQGQAGNPQQGQMMMHPQQQQVPPQGQPNQSQHGMMAPPHHPHMMMPQQAMYGQQGPMMQPMMYQYQPAQQPQQPGMIQQDMMQQQQQQNQQAIFQPQMYNQQQYMQQQQHQVYQMQRGGVVPSYQQQPVPPQGGAGAPRMPMPMNMMQAAPGQAMQMTPQGMMMVNKPQAGGPQPTPQQNQPGAQPQQPQGAQNPAQQPQQQGQQPQQQAPPPQYMGYMMQPGVQPQYIQQAPGGQPQPGQFQYQPMPPSGPGAPPPQGMYNGSAPMYYNNQNNPDYRVK